MNTLFSKEFIDACLDHIEQYNRRRTERVTLPGLFNTGNWRSLPELTPFLEQAESYQHCLFIFTYLYNLAVAEQRSKNFLNLINQLRSDIHKHLQYNHPNIYRSISSTFEQLTLSNAFTNDEYEREPEDKELLQERDHVQSCLDAIAREPLSRDEFTVIIDLKRPGVLASNIENPMQEEEEEEEILCDWVACFVFKCG